MHASPTASAARPHTAASCARWQARECVGPVTCWQDILAEVLQCSVCYGWRIIDKRGKRSGTFIWILVFAACLCALHAFVVSLALSGFLFLLSFPLKKQEKALSSVVLAEKHAMSEHIVQKMMVHKTELWIRSCRGTVCCAKKH